MLVSALKIWKTHSVNSMSPTNFLGRMDRQIFLFKSIIYRKGLLASLLLDPAWLVRFMGRVEWLLSSCGTQEERNQSTPPVSQQKPSWAWEEYKRNQFAFPISHASQVGLRKREANSLLLVSWLGHGLRIKKHSPSQPTGCFKDRLTVIATEVWRQPNACIVLLILQG